MTGFLGEYEATLDAKGRFLLPAGLKKQLPEGDNTQFVINRGFEKCLTLYDMETWNKTSAEVNNLSDFEPKNRVFKRLFNNGAIPVVLDSAGRMLIPPSLKEYAGLSKDIVVASAGNKFEIWDTSKYKEFFESFSPEDYSNLAQEVMSKKQEP